jgi:hypothetical protein
METKATSIEPSVDGWQTVPFRTAPDFKWASTFLAIALAVATSSVLNSFPPVELNLCGPDWGDLVSAYRLPVNGSPVDSGLE